jgi:hypothetical protein
MNLLTEVKKTTKTATTNRKNTLVQNQIKRIEKRIKRYAQKGKDETITSETWGETCDGVFKHFHKEGFAICLCVCEKYVRKGWRDGENAEKEYEDTRRVWKKWNGKGSYLSFHENADGCWGCGIKISWSQGD